MVIQIWFWPPHSVPYSCICIWPYIFIRPENIKIQFSFLTTRPSLLINWWDWKLNIFFLSFQTLCENFNVKRVVFLTDVYGVYDRPPCSQGKYFKITVKSLTSSRLCSINFYLIILAVCWIKVWVFFPNHSCCYLNGEVDSWELRVLLQSEGTLGWYPCDVTQQIFPSWSSCWEWVRDSTEGWGKEAMRGRDGHHPYKKLALKSGIFNTSLPIQYRKGDGTTFTFYFLIGY